jgi:hypothetical protein
MWKFEKTQKYVETDSYTLPLNDSVDFQNNLGIQGHNAWAISKNDDYSYIPFNTFLRFFVRWMLSIFLTIHWLSVRSRLIVTCDCIVYY